MKFIATIASMLTVLFMFWLGGFDFDKRGVQRASGIAA